MRGMFIAAFCAFTMALALAAEDKTPTRTIGSSGKSAKPEDSPGEAKKEKKAPTLVIGSQAPPLNATTWYKGPEVRKYEPGKVYVVEFWATWCGSCVTMMPHLSALQDEYRDKGVTVVGFTSKALQNEEDKVTEFVEKKAKKLRYTFAYENNGKTLDAFMKASGRESLPKSFVIDKAGKIAYIGAPWHLDDVLPKVVAGTWNGKEDAARIDKSWEEYGGLWALRNEPEAMLKALAEFQARWPNLAKTAIIAPTKMKWLIRAKKYSEAKSEAQRLIEEAVKHKDEVGLEGVAGILCICEKEHEGKLAPEAVVAFEALVALKGDEDRATQMLAVNVYKLAGDTAKAKAAGQKAVAFAEAELKASKEPKYRELYACGSIFRRRERHQSSRDRR